MKTHEVKREEAEARQAKRDSLNFQQQLRQLDRLGFAAKKERARLAATATKAIKAGIKKAEGKTLEQVVTELESEAKAHKAGQRQYQGLARE